MDIEERVKTLEAEFQVTREELKQILLDLRAYLMEAQAPFQSVSDMAESSAQNDSEKGVEPDGDRQEGRSTGR